MRNGHDLDSIADFTEDDEEREAAREVSACPAEIMGPTAWCFCETPPLSTWALPEERPAA
jgi:hypothetical protein